MNNSLFKALEEKFKTIYDPEFPMIDIYTLGLIYDIKINEKEKTITVVMTFTTPYCPMAEILQTMIAQGATEVAPTYHFHLETTFDPLRSPSMIKDDDLKRLFDM